MLLIYRILINFFFPLIIIGIYIRKFFNKENKIRYKEKLFSSCFNIIKNNEKRLIWFHAASIGEVKSIIPVIQKLKKKAQYQFLITTTTLSSSKLIEKDLLHEKNIVHRFFPIDKFSLISKFLDGWSPHLTVFVDSEIWPNFILEINKRNIPLVLLNGRITKKTFLRWRLIPQFAKKIFQSFQLSIPANKESQKYLEKFNVKAIKYFGNIKLASEQKFKEISSNDARFFNNRLFWSAVSVHEGEDMFCLKTHLKIKKQHNNITTIIIPRHVDRVKKIRLICKKLNLKYQILSENKDIEKNKEILIVNSYGVTTQFLTLCNSVFYRKINGKKVRKSRWTKSN